MVSFLSIGLLAHSECISGNCSNGKGIYSFTDGSLYEGQFKNRLFHGKGTMKYANGNVYIGNWVKNKRVGKGQLTFANGDQYRGDFENNQFWGIGTYRYADGDTYSGAWANNLANGKGVFSFASKERYEGELVNGKFNGVGAFFYADGTVFIGNWKDNKKHGEGKMHFPSGEKLCGIWVEDELEDRQFANKSEQVTKFKPNEEQLIQEYWKDCSNSFCHREIGQLDYRDGSYWQGSFIDGQPAGQGTMFYSGGNRYMGEIASHAPNGEGIMYFANGQIIGGIWKDGYLIKQKPLTEIKTKPKREKRADVDESVKIWAVIVGVASYTHMPSLRYTDDDAYQIFAFLKSPEGGALPNDQIKLLIDENATRQNILAAMNEVLLKADENDVVLMYYSGHGLPGMFLPIDFDGYKNSLQHEEVLEIFNRSKAKHKLCIADACHSGSLLASRTPFKNRIKQFYDVYEKTRGGTALIMSSKSQEVSLEASGLRQGVFNHYLIRGLQGEADYNDNKIVTVSELYDFIDDGVRNYSKDKQKPSIAGNYDPEMPLSNVRY